MLLALLLVGSSPAAAGVQMDGVQTGPERRVFTYFFYWYEPAGDAPRDLQEDHASLTLHDPPDRPANWRSIDWYKGQLMDMRRAGIDVALAVYWGEDLYSSTAWSTGGLEVLTAALEELAAEGESSPAIGLFFDTYVLQGAHLTETETSEWFLEQLRGFYRRVPGRFLATQDGRPIIWLYYSDYANSFDPESFERIAEALEDELGARPFWVAERSWSYATRTDGDGQRFFDPERPMPFDAFHRWGGAYDGARLVDAPRRLASLGPGYDDRNIAWRGDEVFDRPREDGCYYARAWRDAQALDAHWVVIETWNELYEGSAIAETAEWGRAYVNATAFYARAFKYGVPITLPQVCPERPHDEIDPATLAEASDDAPARQSDPPAPIRVAVAEELFSSDDVRHPPAAANRFGGSPFELCPIVPASKLVPELSPCD